MAGRDHRHGFDRAAYLPVPGRRPRERGRRLHRCLPPLADRLPDQGGGARARATPVGYARLGVLLGSRPPAAHGRVVLCHRIDRPRGRANDQPPLRHLRGRADLLALPSLLGAGRRGRRRRIRRPVAARDLQRHGGTARADRDRADFAGNLADASTRLLGRGGVGRAGSSFRSTSPPSCLRSRW